MSSNERQQARRAERSARAKGYLGGKCTTCSTVEDLQFDHILTKTRSFIISTHLNLSWEKLVVELDKCQLLCGACHRIKTNQNSENGKWLEIKHGTYWGYRKYKCRCNNCTQANKDQHAKYRPNSKPRRPTVTEHGTYAMYKRGCRCLSCKAANASYMRNLRAR